MSNYMIKDDEKDIRRANFTSKVLWFAICLFVIPIIIAIISGFTCFNIVSNIYLSFAFSIDIYFFVALILYRICDKYRNNPYFERQDNNLLARINTLFLISIFSLIISLINDIITLFYAKLPLSNLFPVLSYIIVYIPIFFFYFHKPIDFFDLYEGKFKKALSIKLSFKQLNNIIVFFNYGVSIIFLLATLQIPFSYLILLGVNILFYYITCIYTSSERKNFEEAINNKQIFLIDLLNFKQKFTNSILSALYILIILLPFIFLIELYDLMVLLFFSCLIIILLAFYIKIRLYIFFFYNKIYSNLVNVDKSEYMNEDREKKIIHYKKLNSYLSGIFIISYLIFALSVHFFLQNSAFIIIQIFFISIFFYLLSHYEMKLMFVRNDENRYISLINSIALLISICFGLLSMLLITIQLIVFLVSLLFLLELYSRTGFFRKESIIFIQNVLAVGTYFIIGYGFIYYPFIINNLYIPVGIFIVDLLSLGLLNGIIISGALLFSLYLLYIRKFRGKDLKIFNYSVLASFFCVLMFIITLINLRIYFIVDLNTFFSLFIITITFFPLLLLSFLFINYFFGVFLKNFFINCCYYACFAQVLTILFLNILFIINSFTGLLFWVIFDVILFSILLNAQLRFGKLLGKIRSESYQKFTKINSYVIFTGIILLSFLFFSTILLLKLLTPLDNNVLSIYISLLISCFLVNILSYKGKMFSNSLTKFITFLALFIAPLLVGYYSLKATINTLYILVIPISLFCILAYLPILYLLKIKIKEKIMKKLIFTNSIILSAVILQLPSIIAVEIINYGVINIINATILLFIGVLAYIRVISQKFVAKDTFIDMVHKFQIISTLPLGITAIFYYSYLFLGATLIKTILPLIFTAIYYYFPSLLSYKMKLFKQEILRIIIIGLSWGILGLILLIPTTIAVELVLLGTLIDHFLIMNTFNSTLIVLLGILSLLQIIYKQINSESKIPNKIQILVLFIISFSAIFYYSYINFYSLGLSALLLLPFILTSSYFFIPTYISYKKEFFNRNLIKNVIISNSLFLYGFFIIFPTMIGFNIGMWFTNFFIITPTMILIFGLLKYLEFLGNKLNLKKEYMTDIKILQIIAWFLISLIISLSYIYHIIPFSFLLAFSLSTMLMIGFTMNIYNIYQLESLKLTVFNHKESRVKFIKVEKFKTQFIGIVYFGLIISSSLLFTSLIQGFFITILIPIELQIWIYVLYLGTFFGSLLILLRISGTIVIEDFPLLKNWTEFISWIIIKTIICLLLGLFPSNLSLFYNISFAAIGLSLLTPITRYYLKKLELVSKDKERIVKIVELLIFQVFITIYFIIVFSYFTEKVSYFDLNPIALFFLFLNSLFLIMNYFAVSSKNIIENDSILKLYHYFLMNIILIIGLLYIIPVISIFLLSIVIFHLALNRSKTFINRFLVYISLSLVLFTDIIVLLESYLQISTISNISLGFYFILYFSSLIGVIFSSIILNLKKRTDLDLILLYSLCSIWTFIYLETYTNILFLYNFTIFLFIFLLFSGITLYRRKDKRYKWLIRPCTLLFIFDVVSYLSYRLFFINQIYSVINPYLTFTLTLSVTDIVFIYLYRDLKEKIRQKAFYPVLLSLIFSIPTFIGLILSSYSPYPLAWYVSLIIALNLGIFMFYLSVGIYKWTLSKVIWEIGWWMWIFLPIINIFSIYQGVAGIDVLTNAINVFGTNTNLTGSIILTIIIFTLLYLPILYTKIKKYFHHCLLFVWLESLFLVFWICQNIFILNPFLNDFQRNILTLLSFALIAIILLMPILYKLTRWWTVSILWWVLATINISFITIVLFLNEVYPLIIIPTGVIIGSIFFMIYSYFPNIKNKILYMVLSYISLISGIFTLILFIFYFIFYNVPIAVNLSLIIIAFSLFSSKYLKFEKTDPKKYIHFAISLLLIFNFSTLTYNGFSLIPGFWLFSIFLAIAVGGGSFFVFNYYNMLIWKINKAIPWTIMALGTSFAIYSLCILYLPQFPLINWALFITINIIFVYFWSEKYRSILWYLFPLPIMLLIEELLLFIEILRIIPYITLIILYLGTFQIIINIFNHTSNNREHRGLMKFYENRTKIAFYNFTCLSLQSVLVPLLIAFLTPLTIIYKILEFFMLLSIFYIVTISFAERSKEKLIIGQFKIFNYLKNLFPIFYFSLYLEISLMAFMLILEFIGIFESLFVSLTLLFFLTISDIFLFKRINKKVMYLVNSSAHMLNSIFLSLYLYMILINISQDFSWLVLCIFLTLQFYTIHAFSSFIKLSGGLISERSQSAKSLIYNILYNSIFVIGCVYVSSIFTSLIGNLNADLIGIPLVFLFITIFSFLMFFLNSLINIFYRFLNIGTKKKQRNVILIVFYCVFQIFMIISLFIIFSLLSFLTISSLFLLVLLETLLSYYPFYLFDKILSTNKSKILKQKIFGILTFSLYLEISFFIFGVTNLFLGLLESLLISQIVLFLIFFIESRIINKFERGYMNLLLVIIFIFISVLLFILIISFVPFHQIFLSLSFLIVSIMQFYTNHLIFIAQSNLRSQKNNSNKEEGKIIAQKKKAQQFIGGFFYLSFLFFIIQSLILININWTLIILCVSAIIHGLMKIDRYVLKFLGKISNFLEIGSWGLLMIFSFVYLFLFYIFYLSAIFFTLIPLLWFILTIELVYLLYLLKFSSIIQNNKEKIKSSIIFSFYSNFISWPLFFSTLDVFQIINLILLSAIFLFLLSVIDNYIEIINKKIRNLLRSISILIIGIILAIDLFILIQLYIYPINSAFNLGTSSFISILIFLIFFGFVLKPFKVRHFIAFIYWLGITISASLTLFFGFNNIALSISLICFLLILFPFIFMLEELVKLFRNFIEFLQNIWEKFKQALINFLKKIKQAFVNAYHKLISFLKKYFKIIYIIIIIIICSFLYLFIYIVLNLAWYHGLFITIAIFVVLVYYISPAREEQDPQKQFRWKILLYGITWFSLTIVLLIFISYIPPTISTSFNILVLIFILLMSTVIFGAIILVYIYRLEKLGKLSVKWRFYTSLFFIAVLVCAIVVGVFIGIDLFNYLTL